MFRKQIEVFSVAKRKNVDDDDIKAIARTILEEARKRAKYDMDCLTELVLQEAKIVARYSKKRPFYIS